MLSTQTQGAIREISILQQNSHMLTDLLSILQQSTAAALLSVISLTFGGIIEEGSLKSYWEIPPSLSMQMSGSNQTHKTLAAIALIHLNRNHHVHCLLPQ